MKDKFVLMGLDDENSKHVAEVLKNKTCRKILDFLADTNEASEKDISDSLGLPINTVEYNIQKLVKSGLVKKTSNFFWSVKGRKISMYALAKKHIIISPGKKPSLNYLKSLFSVFLIVAAFAVLFAVLTHQAQPPQDSVIDQTQLKQFSSYNELKSFLEENADAGYYGYGVMESGGIMASAVGNGAKAVDSAAQDYSETNIQVEGVDEPDIVKNDGKYIYTVSGNKVMIVNAYPAESMEVVSEIDLNKSASEIFINRDKLIIFANSYYDYGYEVGCAGDGCMRTGSESLVYIYDISDKENPKLEDKLEFDGNYVDSRMIGGYVYIISTKYAQSSEPVLPFYSVGGVEKTIPVEEVYYFDHPDTNYVFTLISAVNTQDGDVNTKVYLTGGSRNIYVSQDNIYLTYQKQISYQKIQTQMIEDVILPLLPEDEKEKVQKIMDSDKVYYEKVNKINEVVEDYSGSLTGDEKAEFDEGLLKKTEEFYEEINKQMEQSVIHKISVDDEDIEYKGVGEVPGRVLNQFSMDEYDGNFRIATTTGHVSRSGSGSLNHLYILNEDLEIIGKVEDLAEGERIYSVRFLGKRAYIVTFKKVDPLFVIDVENPEKPEVLGYLKITGYSDYLHPYDENHIIGIGKETQGGNEDFSWYQGVKVSLFDVSDVNNPVEKAKIEIGDRGTDSDALYDHKAFLFDKERNLLVIPIRLAEINESEYLEEEGEIPDNAYGSIVWQGVFVLDIGLDGISERGRISHDTEQIGLQKYWYYGSAYSVKRALYMDNYLYTISNSMIKANDLQTIDEIKSLDFS